MNIRIEQPDGFITEFKIDFCLKCFYESREIHELDDAGMCRKCKKGFEQYDLYLAAELKVREIHEDHRNDAGSE